MHNILLYATNFSVYVTQLIRLHKFRKRHWWNELGLLRKIL